MNTTKYWGYHLMLDGGNCDQEAITNPELISKFAKHLVKAIDMVAYGEPQVIHFGEKELAGYTLIQLIETSNICIHFVTEPKSMYMDLFSCKAYDIQTVINLVNEYFKPETLRPTYLTRQA